MTIQEEFKTQLFFEQYIQPRKKYVDVPGATGHRHVMGAWLMSEKED